MNLPDADGALDQKPGIVRRALTTAAITVSLLVTAGLLAAGQYLLNVAAWLDFPRPEAAWLTRLEHLFPPFEKLRLQPLSFPPFLAFAVSGLLFAILVFVRRALKAPGALAVAPLSASGARALLRFPGVLWVVLFLGAQVVVVRQAILAQDVFPAIWLVGILALLLAALTVDRNAEDPLRMTKRGVLRDAGFVLGVAALLSVLAAGHARKPLVMAISAAMALLLLGGSLIAGWRSWNPSQRLERLFLPLLCAGSFLLLSYGLDSWAWSFLGDEYAFHETAAAVVRGEIPPSRYLSGQGAYGYHPVLSSVVQGTTMVLYGHNAYGWKVSHSILLALTILPLYAVARRLLGRVGGFVTAALYGCSHVLISFGKLGSNNSQAVIILPLAMAVLFWAMERGRLVAYALTGVVVGLGFYTFGIARVYSLVVALWLFLYLFPSPKRWRMALLAWTAVVGTSVFVALPVLSTRSAWKGQVNSTILNSEVATTAEGKIQQLARNTFLGSVAYLSSPKPGVFTYGPHTDPVTGSLTVLGLAALFASFRNGPRVRCAILGSIALLVLLIAGIQQYELPNITRTFSLVVVWALLAGAGFKALMDVTRASALVASGLAAVLLIVAVPVNAWMAGNLSVRKLEQPAMAAMLQVAQSVSTPDGTGPIVYVVVPPDRRYWIETLYTIHAIPQDRFRILNPMEALEHPGLCSANQAAVLAMPADGVPQRDAILSHVQRCWKNVPLTLLRDGTGRALVYRALTPAGRPYLHPVPGRLVEEAIASPAWSNASVNREPWVVAFPRGLSAGPGGSLATVEGASGAILILGPDGRPARSLSGGMVTPVSVAFTPDGGLAVLDTAVGDCLIWFDGEGLVKRRGGYGLGISSPQGVAVTADGSFIITDTGSSRLLVLDSSMKIFRELTGGGLLRQPMAVASGPENLVAVADPAASMVFILSSEDRVIARAPLSPGGDSPSGACFLPDGSVLVSDTGPGRVFRLFQDGRTETLYEGLVRPAALAVSAEGIIYVAEQEGHRITRLGPFRKEPTSEKSAREPASNP